MRVSPIRLANAVGGATAILFPVCAFFAYTARDLLVAIFKSMMHSVDVSALTDAPAPPFHFPGFLLSWVVLSLYVWLGGYIGGLIYNAGLKEVRP